MEYIDRSKAKILYYDIETAPNLSYVWGQYEQNVIAHVSEWHMLCVSSQVGRTETSAGLCVR